jgi:pimeloyl-ACP methyl ester carboxylesterase
MLLTIDSALLDINTFVNEVVEGKGGARKFTIIGNSYGDMLAEWYNVAFPDSAAATSVATPLVGTPVTFPEQYTAIKDIVSADCFADFDAGGNEVQDLLEADECTRLYE